MRLASRTTVYVLSVAAHAALGGFVGRIRPPHRTETVAISFTETKKAKPVAPAELPPPEPEAPKVAPVRAKVAPKQAVAPPAANAAPLAAMDALPDFGLSLGGSGAGGLAVPARGAAPAAPVETVAKTFSPAVAPKQGDCTEALVKPKPLSRPTPAYTADARALGISGKVRVEISVDEHGRVASVRVLEALGHGLDEAALAAARAMTFEPATRCGRPSAATFKIGFTFSPSGT
jgi:protein TonB